MAKDHQDGGFAADLRRILSRRAALTAVATAGAGVAAWWILAGSPGGAEANTTTLAMDGSTCTLLPQETAGPFPADGSNALAGQRLNVLAVSGVERRDIRQSFGGLTEDADGILLELEITLVDIDAACAPLSDLAVYIWHCDSAGKYSLYETTESNALRGLQRSDANGVVRFTTLLPGTYAGRWPHIHFEIFASAAAAVSGSAALLTAQFALPEAVVAPAYGTDSRYGASVSNLSALSLGGDMVFGDNSAEQVAAQTLKMRGDAISGFTGLVTVGLKRG